MYFPFKSWSIIEIVSRKINSKQPRPRRLLMKLCVLIPSYNHGETLIDVARAAAVFHPVIVVDDGSTDDTERRLQDSRNLTVVRHAINRGKGAALVTGFTQAARLGFSHTITIDADGQHSAGDIPAIADAASHDPGAFIIGVRQLATAGAPSQRLAANRISNFWFHIETGLRLNDTQCGFRCYPLAPALTLRTGASRYGYELEIMVRAVWAGYPLVPVPVHVDYAAPTSRRSHFRPFVDFARISGLHARLTCQALSLPRTWRKSLSVARTPSRE